MEVGRTMQVTGSSKEICLKRDPGSEPESEIVGCQEIAMNGLTYSKMAIGALIVFIVSVSALSSIDAQTPLSRRLRRKGG